MNFERDAIVQRPLVSGIGLAAFATGVILILCLLLPVALRRQSVALELLPDALSLIYLELSLAQQPADAALRLSVAAKQLQAGRFEAARETLGPLLVPNAPQRERAAHMRVEVERQAWSAIDPALRAARAHALERLIASIDAIDLSTAAPSDVQRMAALYQSLEAGARAAQLLDALARRKLDGFEAHIAAAEEAHLAADQAARAVELRVFFAETLAGEPARQHALRAIELARAAERPAEALALAERLRARLGVNDPQLLAASLSLAEGADVKLAFTLAEQLVRLSPNDVALRRRLAKLADWNGYGLRALDEYVWLSRRTGRAEDRNRAIELARANWDLRLLRELLTKAPAAREPASTRERAKRRSRRAGVRDRYSTVAPRRAARSCGEGARAPRTDHGRTQLRETLGLYEALGDTEGALDLVASAVRGALGADPETLELQVALLQRAGKLEAAADALTALVERFPSQARAAALAQLQLGLGKPREAFAALKAGPEPYPEPYLRQLLDLAWELGELEQSELYAQRIAQLPSATAWDVARLWQLQRQHADPQVPLATALAGFERFKNAESFRLVLDSAQRLNDDGRVAGLLEQAERFQPFSRDPGYWQQRITLHQRLAFTAFERQEFAAAKRELSEAEKALERAPSFAPSDTPLYEELWTSQYAQVLSVALEAGDRAALASVFDRYGDRLSVRQRVYVLHRLDRHAEAFALARLGAADPRLSQADRAALAADRPAEEGTPVIDGTADYARAGSELLHTDGLRIWTHRAELAADSEALGVRLSAGWSELAARGGLRSLQPLAAGEMAADLTGRVWGTELTAGARLRDEGSPRPYGGFRQRVFGDRDEGVVASLNVNATTSDSSQLRLLGATDEAAIDTAVAFGDGYYLTARAAANRYLTFERDYLGTGVTVDSGVGRSIALPDDFGRFGVRVAGRWAPRFVDPERAARQDPRQPARWMPESSGFSGVGASLARGEVAIPQPGDPGFRFLMDCSIGVLWPVRKVGWSGQAALGNTLFGDDQLSAALQAGNVVGSEMFWSLQAGYAVGFE